MPADDDPPLEDPEYVKEISSLRESFPLAVCAAQDVQEVNGRKIRARRYPWGFVEVENEVHCDFPKLRTIIVNHLEDMIERTETVSQRFFPGFSSIQTKLDKSTFSNSNVMFLSLDSLRERDAVLHGAAVYNPFRFALSAAAKCNFLVSNSCESYRCTMRTTGCNA